MDLHVRIALQEADREKRRLISGLLLLAGGLGLVTLALILPTLGVTARRLHDIGRSGWWQLIVWVPVVGVFVALYWYVQPSEPIENKWGAPQPLPVSTD